MAQTKPQPNPELLHLGVPGRLDLRLTDRLREGVAFRHVLVAPLQPLDRRGSFLVVGDVFNAFSHISEVVTQPADQLPVFEVGNQPFAERMLGPTDRGLGLAGWLRIGGHGVGVGVVGRMGGFGEARRVAGPALSVEGNNLP